jgi:flavin reductase (DIM6/NTAB) family NADH-FMN oxidoreductase RutF
MDMGAPQGTPEGVDSRRFRDAVGRFPTGVAVVTARQGKVHHGMTANSFTSVSLDPVLTLVCIDKTARLHEMVLASGEWGVSVLGEQHEWLSRRFARRTAEDRFDDIAHRLGAETGVVLLDEALATFECRTVAVHDGGDHTVLIGEVCTVDLRNPDASPLIYHRGRYRTFGD